MIRDLLLFAYGIAIALVIGTGSAMWATAGLPVFDEMRVAGWMAHPNVGGDNPDPYARAFLARTGSLPLAAAEGIPFELRVDAQGDALNAACSYLVSGKTPAARRWTLHVHRGGYPYIVNTPTLAVATHSRGILRRPDGSFDIRVAPVPKPGNWIYAGPDGPFSLVLTLYDTAIASNTGLVELTMPTVSSEGCGDG